jgi:hypothetical protein
MRLMLTNWLLTTFVLDVLLDVAKSDRLRQAEAEAEKEIAAYKAEREGAYQKKLAEVSGGVCFWQEAFSRHSYG